jgi:hypothetical protein
MEELIVSFKVSDYRLEEWDSISGRGKGFLPLASVIQTSSEAHSASRT